MIVSSTFQNGIILANNFSKSEISDIVKTLVHRKWHASMVRRVDEFGRTEELVDHTQRDALSCAFDTAVDNSFFLERARLTSCTLIKKYWSLNVTTLSAPQFTLYHKNHFISKHRDTGAAFPNRLFSIVTYLTDNYEGGEIIFPDFGDQYHPEIGQTLIFPCDYLHAVNPIISGSKLIFLFFIEVN